MSPVLRSDSSVSTCAYAHLRSVLQYKLSSTLGYPPYRGGGLTNRLSNLLLFLYFSMRLSALSLIAEAYIAALLVRLPLHLSP